MSAHGSFEMNRHSIRLRDYDYSQEGAYFVTICTQNKECLFGVVADGLMVVNNAGRMVETTWDELSQNYSGVDVDAFVVMPNHIHGIVFLTVGVGPCAYPTALKEISNPAGQPQGVAPTMSLPEVVHRFKSLTTTLYRRDFSADGRPRVPGRLWQRNYYDHIIRHDESLNRIREYISTNPLRWNLDRENPQHTGEDEFDHWLSAFKSYPHQTHVMER